LIFREEELTLTMHQYKIYIYILTNCKIYVIMEIILHRFFKGIFIFLQQIISNYLILKSTSNIRHFKNLGISYHM
jgi:hypothetical protein